MKLADWLSTFLATSFRSCAFYRNYQVAALVNLGLQDANIRSLQWNGYLSFVHCLILRRFFTILHPQVWGLPRQFPMSQKSDAFVPPAVVLLA